MGTELAKMYVYRVYFTGSITNRFVEQYWYARSLKILHAKLDYDYQKQKSKVAENFPAQNVWEWESLGSCPAGGQADIVEYLENCGRPHDHSSPVIGILSSRDDYYASISTEEVEQIKLKSIKEDLNKLNKSHRNDNIKKEKSGGCFLTTAVCNIKGKPDDCYELEILRNFRDEYLLSTKEGKKLVKDYYSFAPELALKLEKHFDSSMIAEKLYFSYIIPIINDIQKNKKNKAINKYKNMINTLEDDLTLGHKLS